MFTDDEILELIVNSYKEIVEETNTIDLEEELEWDSFDKMRFVLQMEEQSGLNFDDILLEIVNGKTLAELAEAINCYIKKIES